jgi:hypothetical protein
MTPLAVKAEPASFHGFESSAPSGSPTLALNTGPLSIAGPSADGDQNIVYSNASTAHVAQATTASIKLADYPTAEHLGNSWRIGDIAQKNAPTSMGLFCIGLLGLIGVMKIRPGSTLTGVISCTLFEDPWEVIPRGFCIPTIVSRPRFLSTGPLGCSNPSRRSILKSQTTFHAGVIF